MLRISVVVGLLCGSLAATCAAQSVPVGAEAEVAVPAAQTGDSRASPPATTAEAVPPAPAVPSVASPLDAAPAATESEPPVELPSAPAALPTVGDAAPATVPAAAPTSDDAAATPSITTPEPAEGSPDAAAPAADASVVAASAAAAALVGPPALLPEADPMSETFIGPPVMPNFRILGQEVLPGAKAKLEWSASQSFAGAEVISPVTVVHGTRPGPVLCLTAAIHGDELNGVEIVRRVVNGIDAPKLSGTVIAVPIVNLFGFSRNSRYLPDRRDLNRFFPGTRRGSIASRIAESFFQNVVTHCEALVDFHTGSFDRSNLPQVRADLRLSEVLRFVRGFGDIPVLHSNGSRGMLRVAATQAGIPSVTFEVGAPALLQVEEIGAGVRAINALLHHLGMSRDAPMVVEPQAIFYDSLWVRANAGGLLIAEVELGQTVSPGQRLGIVVDPIHNVEREITAPLYGRVIGMARNQVVLPGFASFHLGEVTSEERAVLEAESGMQSPVEEDPDPAMSRDADGMPVDDER